MSPGPHGLQKTRRAVSVSNHGDFEPTFNDILIGFQDGRSKPYSWTMDNGDSFNELGPKRSDSLCRVTWRDICIDVVS